MTMPPQWGTGMRYYFNGIQLFMRNTMFIHSIQLNEFQIAVSRFQTANNRQISMTKISSNMQSSRLRVTNLPKKASKDDLKQLFQEYGRVTDVQICHTR